MKIPRQKKTVRLAVTRPSVKKGAIATRLMNRSRQRRSRSLSYGGLVLWSGFFPAVPTPAAGVPALIFTLQLGVNELECFIFSVSCSREKLCVSLGSRSHQSL